MAEKRPNFLFLVAEDTGRHHGCYGDPVARTPHLDKLASEGVRYTRAYSHCPVCGPSRGSLVSGHYPWAKGFLPMRSTLRQPPRLFTHDLVEAGYEVKWPTKLDFNFEPEGAWRSDESPWWEEGLPSDRPFFAYRNVYCTHESGMFTPPDDRSVLQEPVTESLTDPESVPIPSYLPDLPEVRLQLARYYDNLAAQDRYFGECLEALEASGQADRTVVIYLSDHGRGFPREKRWCFDAGIHMPLLVRWPGKIAAGISCDELISWVDIAPTILSLAGLPVPDEWPGRVFLGPEAGSTPPRQFHFSGRDRMDEAYDCQRACVEGDWLYVRNYFPEIPMARRVRYQEQAPAVQAMRRAHAAGELRAPADIWFRERSAEELYHLATDPDGVVNLAGEKEQADRLKRMREALRHHLETVGDHGMRRESHWVREGLLVDRIGEYSERLGALPDGLGVEPTPDSIEMPVERRPII